MTAISLDNIAFYYGPPQASDRRITQEPYSRNTPIAPMLSLPRDLPANGIPGRDYEDQALVVSVTDNRASMPGQPDPEHLDFPSLELLQATAHEGAGEGYPFMEYHTQPWVWASDVNSELAFDEVSFDMSAGEESRPGVEVGAPGWDDFIPIERFSLQPAFIPCVDLSTSAEDQGSYRPSYIRPQSVFGDNAETPILILDSDDSSDPSIDKSPSATNSFTLAATDALEDNFAYHDTYRSIEPCETIRASPSRGSKADEQGDTAKDSPSFPAAATAFSPGGSPDVTINSTHLATSTAITTKECPSRQVSLPDMAAETPPSHGCFDDLSEDELHGPSLYPVVRPKRSSTVRQTGHAVRCRIPSPCFLWESRSDSDSSAMGASIAKKVVKATVAKQRSRAPIRRRR